MKLNSLKKVTLALLAAVLLLGALPQAVLAADDVVRFRVENRADRGITIRLYATDGSGRAYYMRIEEESTKVMTPLAGVYTYRLTACGVMVKGTLDLSKNVNWIMPQCGDKGGPGTAAPNTQDIGKILKLVSVRLVNRTGSTMKIWLEGPFQYVFTIPNGGSKTVSILKGEYEWGHYACDGALDEGKLHVVNTMTRVFECD
jgi:hypothetical protein